MYQLCCLYSFFLLYRCAYVGRRQECQDFEIEMLQKPLGIQILAEVNLHFSFQAEKLNSVFAAAQIACMGTLSL